MTKTIEEILPLKPEARLRVYAYSIDDDAHRGLLKVGQTTRDVKQRVAEQLKTAAIKNYRIELDEPADRADGSTFTDHEVRGALVKKGFDNPELEWMRCTVADVLTVLTELRTGQRFTGPPSPTPMCGCCPTCNTPSGFCPTWLPVTPWPTCWPNDTIPSGMPTG